MLAHPALALQPVSSGSTETSGSNDLRHVLLLAGYWLALIGTSS